MATVLQPVSDTHTSTLSEDKDKEMSKFARALLMVVGMFTPFVIGAILGHGHEHGHTARPVALA